MLGPRVDHVKKWTTAVFASSELHMQSPCKPNPNTNTEYGASIYLLRYTLYLDLSYPIILEITPELLQDSLHSTSTSQPLFTLTTVLIFLFPLVALSRQRLSTAVSMAFEELRGLGLSRPSSTEAAQRHKLI